MRTVLALLLLPLSTELVAADTNTVASRMRPLAADIQQCYLDGAGTLRQTGKLVLTLDIDRDGALEAVTVQTPGLVSRQHARVELCIRKLVGDLTFPAVQADTTATLPYVYLKTPGPGPQLSCWSLKGCPGR